MCVKTLSAEDALYLSRTENVIYASIQNTVMGGGRGMIQRGTGVGWGERERKRERLNLDTF